MKYFQNVFWAVFLIVSMGVMAGCMKHNPVSKPGTTTTVVLIRHADRDDSLLLTKKGRERAKALVKAVDHLNISVIYSPDLQRNLDTVRPLAEHLGIEITLTSKFSLFAVEKIAGDILDKHAGRTILWVGNVSGNLQALYQRLGGKADGPIKYGQISILTIPDQGDVTETLARFDP